MADALLAIPLAVEAGLGFGLANLILVLLAAWTAGRLADRIGYPAVLGELLAGILLGPPLLGLLATDDGLAILANLGVVLMMLYIGVEIDFGDLRRASRAGILAASGGFIVPAVAGTLVVLAFGGDVLTAAFVGSTVAVTSLATGSRILVDLDLLDTRIAYVLVAGALVSDTATLVAFAAITGFAEAGGFDLPGTVQVAGEAAAFFGATGLLGLLVVPRIVDVWQRRVGIIDRTLGFVFVLTVGLVFAGMAELAGLHPLLGAFVGGLFIRKDLLGHRVQHEVEGLLRDLSIGFLAPVFFVIAGFEVTFDVFSTDLALLLSVVAVAILGKIVGTALFYLPSGHSWREGVVVGFGMNGRGGVDIVVAGIGLEIGLISSELFTILVFAAIASTASVPLLLAPGVRWLRRRGELARAEERRQAVVIMGAGAVARVLADELSGYRPVRLVDSNADRCQLARERGFEVIHGDVLDADILQEAHLGRARTVLALTTNSEVNVLAAQLARSEFHVPVVGVAGHTTAPAMVDMLRRIGATPLWGEDTDLVRWDHLVATGRAKLVRIPIATAREGPDLLADLETERNQLPLLLERDGRPRPLVEADQLDPGDEILALRHAEDRPEQMPWAAMAARNP